ncbi:DUF1003 domain-containing protein [Microbacterium sp. CJ88]|uniref:DUF1003 domain-containing protein n=1 Tax=Microbacterium sp. CJ88 TaxID=3445672 RepID=UPI003F656A7D
MARSTRQITLDAPRNRGGMLSRTPQPSSDRFGRFSESFARAMGTSGFLIGMTIFVTIWLVWNSVLPEEWQFDPKATNFTLLTLILSLQASYAAPLILLAQNRQDDRDRVQIEQDRQRAERNLADTEYLAREIVALRMAINERSSEVVTRETLRSELKAILEQLDGRDTHGDGGSRSEKPERAERSGRSERSSS